MLVIFALALHTKYQPYDLDELDNLETLSLFGSFLTMFFGLFFVVPGVPYSWKIWVTIAILVVNCFIAFLFAKNVLQVVNEIAQSIKEEKG